MNKQAIITAVVTVALLALVNQFDATRNLVNGGNKFFR